MVILVFVKTARCFNYLSGRDIQTGAHAHRDDIKMYISENFSFQKGKHQALASV